MKAKVSMLSLGCARNLVDAEVILGYLKEAGLTICAENEDADIAIVNTCCFIREAEEESIDVILKLGRLKEEKRIKKIIVCGCLVQRHQRKLLRQLPEIDACIGVGRIDKIGQVVKQLLAGRKIFGLFGQANYLYTHCTPRELLTPKHFAYVKICEGCSHNCSYCVIPRLRGKYRSRPMDSILKEAEMLFRKRGVAELNLIGQDTTMYGQDLYGQRRIAELLKKIANQAHGKWMRLLYAHPADFPDELISVIKEEASVCKYLDLPIQHINDKILKLMQRRTTQKEIRLLIEKLRKKVPNLTLRTTLIVGFPQETDAQFQELLEFMRETKFERLGLFKYSREENSPAFNFGWQVPEKLKQARYDQALSLQQEISRKINAGFLGKELTVLIDEEDEEDKTVFLGRTQYDAPEVDGCVYVRASQRLKPGDFVQVKITDTLEYDLAGEWIKNESTQ